MSLQNRLRALVTIALLFLASCDFIKIKSSHEPADDAAALHVVGIATTPPPKVVFRAYEGGLDDNMRLVIRFPKTQLASFWSSSPWRDAERKEIFPHQLAAVSSDRPTLGGGSEPDWMRWETSSRGIRSKANLPNARYAEIYVALDQDDFDAIGYIFWTES